MNFSEKPFLSESLHKDEDECESSGSPGATVGLPYGRANGAIEAVQLDGNKTSKELLCNIHSSPQHSNLGESSKSHSLPLQSEASMTKVETGDFQMSSDDDLFGDLEVLENLCESSYAADQLTKDQQSYHSLECVDVYDKPKQCFIQPVASVVEKKSKTSEHTNEAEVNFTPSPHPLDVKKINVKEDNLGEHSSIGQKQQSILAFVRKGKEASKSKTSLKQTDIGVFFGLKPLKKPAKKITTSQNGARITNSSQSQSASQRQGHWATRKTFNNDRKNTGFTTEGQSSSQSEGLAGSNRTQTQRSCPFYKKIPNSAFTVDAFRYGNIPGCHAYFLSHFHYDHYMGLNGKFKNPIYCSKVIDCRVY